MARLCSEVSNKPPQQGRASVVGSPWVKLMGEGPLGSPPWVLPSAPSWWKAGTRDWSGDPRALVADPLLSAVQRRGGLAP